MQAFIAILMAVCVVDGFECIYVKKENHGTLGCFQTVHLALICAAVEQIGQDIVLFGKFAEIRVIDDDCQCYTRPRRKDRRQKNLHAGARQYKRKKEKKRISVFALITSCDN